MSQYHISSSNLTFSLYENKIVYSRENDSVKKECTEYWFNNQNEIHSLEEMSEIELGQWDEQEKKKDQAKWEADYLSALADYADNNCDKFEEFYRSGYTNIDDLKESAKYATERLKDK